MLIYYYKYLNFKFKVYLLFLYVGYIYEDIDVVFFVVVEKFCKVDVEILF